MRMVIRLSLLCLMLLAAAVPAHAQSARPAIRLAVGSDPAFSPIYYAAQQKMFERAGLNVQLLQLAQSADAADGLIAGINDMAGGSETTMLTRAARGDVRTIAVFGQSARFIKLVARDGIGDPTQLKKIGIVPGSASQFVAARVLKKYGMDEKAVTWVRGAPPEFPALLARGDVDGYVLWEPWPARGLQAGGKALLVSGDVGYSYNMLLGASGKWLEQNGREAQALVEVLRQACEEIRSDPDKAAQATQTAIKLPAAQARELLKDVECVVRDFTPQDRTTYGEIADFLLAQKTTAQRVDVDRMMQSGFVRGAGR